MTVRLTRLTVPLKNERQQVIGVLQLINARDPKTGVVVRFDSGIQPTIEAFAIVAAAVLDVFDQEPLPQGHQFYALENVLLSPHSADHTATWLDEAMSFFIANFERWAKDEPLAALDAALAQTRAPLRRGRQRQQLQPAAVAQLPHHPLPDVTATDDQHAFRAEVNGG